MTVGEAPSAGPGDEALPPVRRPRGRDPEYWISIGALVVSALAMASSMLQFAVQRSQERAAAWPYLSLSASYSDKGFSYVVTNKGMGPALVRDVVVLLEGRPVSGWPGVLDELFGPDHTYGWDRIGVNELRDVVLSAGERVVAFSIPWDEKVRPAFANGSRFEVRACYCSVLGDCWITRRGVDHQAVDACPATLAASPAER
jgi:hypothetical protein